MFFTCIIFILYFIVHMCECHIIKLLLTYIILSGLVNFHFIHTWPMTLTLSTASTWMHWATRILVHYFYLLHFHPTLLHIDTLLFHRYLKLKTHPLQWWAVNLFTNCWPAFSQDSMVNFQIAYLFIVLSPLYLCYCLTLYSGVQRLL